MVYDTYNILWFIDGLSPIAQFVNITSITMVYESYNELVNKWAL